MKTLHTRHVCTVSKLEKEPFGKTPKLNAFLEEVRLFLMKHAHDLVDALSKQMDELVAKGSIIAGGTDGQGDWDHEVNITEWPALKAAAVPLTKFGRLEDMTTIAGEIEQAHRVSYWPLILHHICMYM